MTRDRWPLALILVLFMLMAVGTAAAQETEGSQESEPAAEAEAAAETEAAPEAQPSAGTEFVTTVDFSPLNGVSLDGSAGEIEVRRVEFEVAGAKGGGIKGAFSSDDADMNAIITTRLSCATKSATKWKIDILVEFLDADGKVIDRVTDSESLKNNEKTFNFKHTTLRWAVDHIAKARITVQAKQ
jgi:hypothetical protein